MQLKWSGFLFQPLGKLFEQQPENMNGTDEDRYRSHHHTCCCLGNIAATTLELLGFQAPEQFLPSLLGKG